MVRLEGLGKLENPHFDQATFLLVAYCLNKLRYRVPSTLFIQRSFKLSPLRK
jgi:hypothetical protein